MAADEHDSANTERALEEQAERTSERSRDGRYVPYGGGSSGWFENSGVLKHEERNNYQFHTVMDYPEVRRLQYERWGASYDRRGSGKRVRRELPVNVIREGESMAATSWDLSPRGLRLQFLEAPDLAVGEELGVELLRQAGDEPFMTLRAEVVWVREAHALRTVWQAGLYFPRVSAADAANLEQLMSA